MSPQIKKGFSMVRKRDGRVVPFDATRVTDAVLKSMQATQNGAEKDAEKVSARVVEELLKRFPTNYIIGIEEIQDVVEETLILLDYAGAAKGYILYRQERAALRSKRKELPEHVKRLALESKKYFRNPLAEFIYYRTYSRWIPDEGRRETWIESVDRYMGFMKEKLGDKLTDEEYVELREGILRQEAMPSMRLLWSAGGAARATNVAGYNCSFIAPTKIRDFSEIMYLSMCGAGVGFSVEQQHVQKLPQIKRQTGKMLAPYVIEDSKEGWAEAAYAGFKTWFDGRDITFDYSKVRPLGARLKTMGGKSSGPGPLRELLGFARKKILAKQGKRLSSLDVHDIICKIGEIVVMGGVRRSALISFSDLDDQEMRFAKSGQFFLNEPQRQMANNSVVYNEKPTCTEFLDEWVALAKNGTGERGIFNRGALETQLPARRWKVFAKDAGASGTNPCLTGDTLVYVADGRGNVSMKILAEEGKDVPVFCLDVHGQPSIRTMRNPRLTGRAVPVYRMTLDDGSTIKTTANHQFRLKSDEYKAVKDLVRGDSLAIITKFEAPVGPHKRAAQDYFWINDGHFSSNYSEHRLIAEFYHNRTIPRGYVVHHIDRNAQNNNPQNLVVMRKEDHDALHAAFMVGDRNPMRRARQEWDEEKWANYRLQHSQNNSGNNNKNFSGISHEALQQHALHLTKMLGYRFSNNDWVVYAKANNLPQYFSQWRDNHLGGILGLAKWAAFTLGFDFIDVDPRLVKSYRHYTALGYDCEIVGGELQIIKHCEVCGSEFRCDSSHREYGVCCISCGLKKMWKDPRRHDDVVMRINASHTIRKQGICVAQAKIYSDLRFRLGRDPLKKEWASACKENDVSFELARISSPFRSYAALRKAASAYNHKVVSVEFCGYEDVYNGTVDEFHNFFVGGFCSVTKKGKRKFIFLNNLNCGEIVLKSKEFCNLSEVVARAEDTRESLLRKVRLASMLGTYQSTLTDFPFLSKQWREHCEEERLLGVSLTGQWDCPAVRDPAMLRELRDEAIRVNKIYAKRFGVNSSVCVTCVKPSGTVSQLVDAASGLHARHAQYYIRRVRIAASDALFEMLRDQKVPYQPEVGQSKDEATTYVLEFPIKAPEKAVFRNDMSAIAQLEHWKMVKENFTEHNPSVTISVGKDEWVAVAQWLYEHWSILGGLSFLPREDHVYALAVYEEIDEARYNEMVSEFPEIDFAQILIYEKDDETQGAKELACVAGLCEIA